MLLDFMHRNARNVYDIVRQNPWDSRVRAELQK